MTRSEVATFLAVSTRTVANYVSSGKLHPVYVKGPTRDMLEFDAAEVEMLKGETEGDNEERSNAKQEKSPTEIVKVEASPLPLSEEESGNRESGNFLIISEQSFSTLLEKMDTPRAPSLIDKPILTFAEAALLTSISEKMLREAAKRGELKARKIGRSQRIRHTDLMAWIDSQFV